LLSEADKIQRGKVEPLTDREIDEQIDETIRSADPMTAKVYIELRDKRKAARPEATTEGPIDPIKTCSEIKNPLLAAFVLAEHNITKAPDWLKQSFPAAAWRQPASGILTLHGPEHSLRR
jgi:hypothetical protein